MLNPAKRQIADQVQLHEDVVDRAAVAVEAVEQQ
jgi:hypothetical protein